ncbi:hypothetical protein [Roseateles saccharophilus]|nr:hypothetical protein [Roseateles saccharophilus]MDG0832127.1 hypothetical protein [Roseateles saccharophilus]
MPTSQARPRRHVAAALLALIAGLAACAVPVPAARPVVPQPRLELQPAQLLLAPGGEVRLAARPQGGEAILFHVDWQVAEGQAGGRLEPVEARAEDGSYAARYVAPPTEGVFHVVARLREYPAAEAHVEIRVRR